MSSLELQLMRARAHDFLLVTDREIGEAVLALLREAHILAEPSGATSLAALLFKYHPEQDEKVAVIISGANISIDYLTSLLNKQK